MSEPAVPPPTAVGGLRPSATMPATMSSSSSSTSHPPSQQQQHQQPSSSFLQPPSSQHHPQPPPPPTQRQPSFSQAIVPGPAIPVTLTEAALDSPTFRATAVHFSDQLDAIERWLDSYQRSTTKLVHDMLALEDSVGAYLSKISPPAIASPADSPVLDADYTLPALRRAGEGAREWWGGILAVVRRLEPVSVEPVRGFVQNELRGFRETRRVLDAAQKTFDGTLARYVGQSKTKEPSALREDAFAVFETRRAYLKASLDYCQMAPQVRAGLDRLLVRVCADMAREMRRTGESSQGLGSGSGTGTGTKELERIRGWVREMEMTEGVFKRELQMARRGIGETTLAMHKPSRELEDYSVSTVPFLGSSKGPMSMQRDDQTAVISEKQGWLFLRVLTGKPVRTTWIRRWYYCRDGIFGWLVQSPQGVLQGDEIGVLLCSARPAVQEERRFCFEIKTKTQTILLQAETQAQLIEWLEVFEVAKKKAIEASMGRDPGSALGSADPAFSITPPSIPEFSAKMMDSGAGGGSGMDEGSGMSSADRGSSSSATLPVPGQDPGLTRASFDAHAPPRRAITTHLAREEGETGREHAARIMQNLHRKSAFASSTDAPSSSVGAGTATGASATSPHLGYPSSMRPPADHKAAKSLAPITLAKPPIATNLSKTAILASANAAGSSSSLPTAVLANYWGSSPYTSVYCPSPSIPNTPKPDMSDPFVAAAAKAAAAAANSNANSNASLNTGANSHRKTVSVDATVTDIRANNKRGEGAEESATKGTARFPANYPPELRAQYAQFRLFFPTAPVEDKPVLVFNAAWSSSAAAATESTEGNSSGSAGNKSKEGGMAGNGRIFVTADRMYFYGDQMGLVVAYAINLDSITELTAAPGRDCDFIFLHLNQGMPDISYARITVKVFLEDFALLQARLNLLVDDLQAAEPMELEEIIGALSTLKEGREGRYGRGHGHGGHHGRRSPSVESWEDVASDMPLGRPLLKRSGRDSHGRFGHKKSSVHKVQLPTHPVVYEPPDMGKPVAERHFEISAKSCFHVLFGDKSFLFPKLYFERGAQEIAQGGWELQDHGRMRRQFRFRVEYVDMLGRKKPGDVADTQTIDIFQDHITYVVAHTKTAWHLPHSHAFKLITKVVVTHLAKSKCKLAIYTRAEWATPAPTLTMFVKNMVQRQALDDAANDAEELADLATDQVRKLGPHSRTKRAIQVYGNIGQQQQTVVFSPDATPESWQLLQQQQQQQGPGGMGVTAVRPRTLTDMMLETGRSFLESAITSVMMWAYAALRRLFRVVRAHRVILVLLVASVAYNVVVVSQAGAAWWVERRSARYMSRLGVGPNGMMGRAVYLADLEGAVRVDGKAPGGGDGGESQCYQTFQSLLNSTTTSLDAPSGPSPAWPFPSSSSSSFWTSSSISTTTTTTSSTTLAAARRLRRVRQRMGAYRHDLLVALRVVNRVEQEMVQSEWETWLAGETRRCEMVGGVLLRQQEEEEGKGTEGLRAWFGEYCASCAVEERRVGERGLF
ncbi:uncharacterized protein C8A04DRAFT_15992 [Dichotomopilus funicola]|uniref:Uncharacterized protein n=1 Tax=Dichotomopilus funicola TaxID=1934379 RepID=A0AAN6ZIY6_9PEZI|nr:hypothetical protein C8A04DRAFT_15992 [Dichotomopilus funicola]